MNKPRYDEQGNQIHPDFHEYEVMLEHAPTGKKYTCTVFARNEDDAEECAFSFRNLRNDFPEIDSDEWNLEMNEIIREDEDEDDGSLDQE